MTVTPIHADAVFTKRKLRELDARRLAELKEILSGEAVNALSSLLTFGILGVANSFWRVVKALRGDPKCEAEVLHQANESPGETALRLKMSGHDALLATLELLLEEELDGLPVPVVIAIDDAQFLFEKDESLPQNESLGFIQRLWRRAKQRGWPLLILATHWDDHWEHHKQEFTPEDSPRSLVHLLTLDGVPLEPGAVRRLEKLPHSALVPTVNKAMPGLTADQTHALLERVDGNPEILRVQSMCATGPELSATVNRITKASSVNSLCRYSTERLHKATDV